MRFSFQEAQQESGQTDEVEILKDYYIQIRPIAPAQLDYIAPIIKRLFKKFRDLQYAGGKEDLSVSQVDALEIFIDAAFCSEESRNDTFHLIYSVMDRPDAKVYKKRNGVVIAEYDLFEYDDMVSNCEIADLIQIVKIIWKQNAQKIFSSVTESAKTGTQEPEKKEEEEETEGKKVMGPISP